MGNLPDAESARARIPPMWLTQRLGIVTLLALGACSDSDVIGVYINLAENRSGSITTHSLKVPNVAGPAEIEIKAVSWSQRANLFSSAGSFEDISNLRIGEVRFDVQGKHLQVTLPRGPEVRWYRFFAPSADEQELAALTFDPTGKAKNVGTIVKFDVQVPGIVISAGVYPQGIRNVSAEYQKANASLWVPLRAMRKEGDELIWSVSWK